ncbi:MAG: glycosyltransferase family 39 protein [Bacteroidota bacterium]|nr:glycosyltransferase family 39 protein [Bacteroidota bacterium]
MKNDALTFDELSHIPAGYSYVSQQDYRLNPEHPPLIKTLSALPLLSLDLNFPENHPTWIQEQGPIWWLQFDFGTQFLFNSDNPADKIIFLARLPMILLLMLLGLFIFFWTRQLAGNKFALMTLTLFSFSPTFLAHGRFVTTDVAATLGVVMATYFWLKFLKNPSKKNIILAGIIFGIVMLFKFSLILLIPFFGIITTIYPLLKHHGKFSNKIKQTLKYVVMAFLVGIIAVVFVILPAYYLHTVNYPPEKQLSDTLFHLGPDIKPSEQICIYLSDKPVVRALGHYMMGILMAGQRTVGGNTVYFMEMVSASGWWFYFPVIFALKIPLALLALIIIALLPCIWTFKLRFWVKPVRRIKQWILKHFTEFSMLTFMGIYLSFSMYGNLNIGIRHILPIFPFMYILICLGIKNLYQKAREKHLEKFVLAAVLILSVWYIGSSVKTFPYYLSYYNELAGGTHEGYKHAVDSNYDWGQDLKRLVKYTEKNNIDNFYIDYFGGSNLDYYFGDRYIKWESRTPSREFPKGNYLAVSANHLQGGRGFACPDFDQPTNYYRWLDQYEPIARIGTSIFLYYID